MQQEFDQLLSELISKRNIKALEDAIDGNKCLIEMKDSEDEKVME